MKVHLPSLLAMLIVACSTVQTPQAQKAPPATPAKAKKNPLLKLIVPWPDEAALKARRAEAEARPLFQSVAPLEFTLSANFSTINKDHNPESTRRYPGVLTVAGPDGAPQTIPVTLSARGHFRRMARNCGWVPLRIELPRDGIAGTVFDGQTTLKLGTGCEAQNAFEQYTLREYLTYPLFNLVTPLSFRARLARATYVEESSQKKITTRYALFIEHENDVARRNEGRIVELPRVEFKSLDAETLTRMMLFEYMIGNTDFSIWALHNVRLVQTPARTLLPVPYDFDLSGCVHAPYANPDRRLGLKSVLDRLYRGPCRTTEELDAAAAPFRAKRAETMALLDSIRDLDATDRRDAKEYLEAFFRAIERPASIKRQFVDGCKPEPTM
jgi:hypothetical protein